MTTSNAETKLYSFCRADVTSASNISSRHSAHLCQTGCHYADTYRMESPQMVKSN